MEAVYFLAATLSGVEGQPKRYSGQRDYQNRLAQEPAFQKRNKKLKHKELILSSHILRLRSG